MLNSFLRICKSTKCNGYRVKCDQIWQCLFRVFVANLQHYMRAYISSMYIVHTKHNISIFFNTTN